MRASPRLLAALPYVVFLLLTAVSWKRWIEPYVDTGPGLMIPDRLLDGEALYRDVRFYYGPLAPYLSAAVDALAGRSLAGRILLAAAVALLQLEALRRLALRLLSPARAALATSLIVAVAFFLRSGGCHLFPYSLSTALALAASTWALHLSAGRNLSPASSGWLLVALLSRVEIGLAALLALAVERRSDSRGRRRTAWLLISPALLAGLVYAVFSLGTPLSTLKREGWLLFLSLPTEYQRLYRSFAGLDSPGLRLAELALAGIVLAVIAALLFTAGFASVRLRRRLPEAIALALLAALALLRLNPSGALAGRAELFPPLIRVLPAALFLASLWRIGCRLRRRPDGGPFEKVPDAVLFLAALLALRMFLAANYSGPYNAFLLPLPLLVGVAGVFHLADRAADLAGASGHRSFGRLVAGALSIWLVFRSAVLFQVYRHPSWALIQTPVGSLYAPEPVATTTRAVLSDLQARLRPGDALAGFPEAGFFQYALGLREPLAQDQFFPGQLGEEAERDAIRALQARPPAAVLFANVLPVGMGPPAFGRDYLRDLDRFVRENFAVAAAYGPGAQPGARIGDPDFFVEIRVPSAPGGER